MEIHFSNAAMNYFLNVYSLCNGMDMNRFQ